MDLQDQKKVELKALPDAAQQPAAQMDLGHAPSPLDKTTPSLGSEFKALIESSTTDLLVGTVIDGKYEILSIIGSGGMGRVYKARHIGMDKLLAIKTMHRSYASDEVWRRRFLQEAKTASSLAHDQLVAVHDFGETPHGEPYLVMDYVHGVTLSSLIKDGQTLPVERAMQILSDVSQALDYAHSHGVIHRDVKPSNIMIHIDERRNERAKLVDFGVCKPTMAQDANKEDLTRTGDICGSPRYMSPEQCLGRPLDARADIYSLGCVMYEVFAGKPPFTGENSIETIMRQVNDKPVPLKQANPKAPLPKDLDAVVLRCLEKEPDKRYQNMDSLRRDIELVRSGRRIDKPRSGTTPHLLKWLSGIAALALVVPIVFLGIFLAGHELHEHHERHAPPAAVAHMKLPQTVDEARMFAQQAYRAESNGDMYKAGYMLERVLPIFEKAGMESSPEYGSALVNYAICLRESGHAKESLPIFLTYAAWAEQRNGGEDRETAEAQFNLGLAYHYMQDEVNAVKALRKSVDILHRHPHEAGPDGLIAPSLSLANSLHDSGKDAEALPLYEKYLRNSDGTLADTSPLKLGALEGYAWTLEQSGHHQQAESALRHLIDLRESMPNRDNTALARHCRQLSQWLRDDKNNDEADEFLRKTTRYANAANAELNR